MSKKMEEEHWLNGRIEKFKLDLKKPFYNQDPTFKSQIGPEPQNCFYF